MNPDPGTALEGAGRPATTRRRLGGREGNGDLEAGGGGEEDLEEGDDPIESWWAGPTITLAWTHVPLALDLGGTVANNSFKSAFQSYVGIF